jgi:hypothetical protein
MNLQFAIQALQAHTVRATPNSVLSVSIVDPFYNVGIGGKITAWADYRMGKPLPPALLSDRRSAA